MYDCYYIVGFQKYHDSEPAHLSTIYRSFVENLRIIWLIREDWDNIGYLAANVPGVGYDIL